MSLNALAAAIWPKMYGSSTIGVKKSTVLTTARSARRRNTPASSEVSVPTIRSGCSHFGRLCSTCTRSAAPSFAAQPAAVTCCVNPISLSAFRRVTAISWYSLPALLPAAPFHPTARCAAGTPALSRPGHRGRRLVVTSTPSVETRHEPSQRIQSGRPDMQRDHAALASLPSVDRLLRSPWAAELVAGHGRLPVTDAIRAVLSEVRSSESATTLASGIDDSILRARVTGRLEAMTQPSLRPVFNLTGTVLHTNLGRARLAPAAAAALARIAQRPANLEFDLTEGARGDRDTHVEGQLCRLTGAEAATVVNNNAAAVLLVLNTLARGKEVPTSRGE